MLLIQDNVIKMTKGDSATFEIKVRTPEGKRYSLKENDKIIFYLSKYPCEELIHSPLIVKTFNNNLISLDSIDTKFLKFGEYYWKCELIYDTGEINSICGGKLYLTCVSNK